MTTTQATVAHNVAAWNGICATLARANTDACPKCAGPANATVVARFGHCIPCQNAAWGR